MSAAVERVEQPTIETNRLILEPFKESDLHDILAYASNPEITRFVPWAAHRTIEDSRSFLENTVLKQTNSERGRLFFVFAIRWKESGRVIGSIDFKNINSICGQIGYALGVDYWGKGIMSEAAAAVRDWAFSAFPELTRLQAYCVVDNRGSSRVMEKIGMTREGLRRKAFPLKGQPVDLLEYSVLREELK